MKPPTKPSEQPPKAQPSDEPRSMAETISFAIASMILIAVLGGAGYLWVSDRTPLPPTLEITSTTEYRQGKYYVPFTVKNTGGETAESVQVIAELRIEGTLVEWGDQQIDFLSSQEEATGAFILTRDPALGELTLRVASYKKP